MRELRMHVDGNYMQAPDSGQSLNDKDYDSSATVILLIVIIGWYELSWSGSHSWWDRLAAFRVWNVAVPKELFDRAATQIHRWNK